MCEDFAFPLGSLEKLGAAMGIALVETIMSGERLVTMTLLRGTQPTPNNARSIFWFFAARGARLPLFCVECLIMRCVGLGCGTVAVQACSRRTALGCDSGFVCVGFALWVVTSNRCGSCVTRDARGSADTALV